MVKMSAKAEDGRTILVLGLSHANLDRLRADGLKGFIKVEGKDFDLPCDVILTAGETEAAIATALQEFIGPDTKVTISQRLKQ